MKTENVKPISQIKAEKELLAQKDAKIAQLEAENASLKSDSLMTMEAVAEFYEEFQAFKAGGTP